MMLFGFAGIAAIAGLIFAAVVLVALALQPREVRRESDVSIGHRGGGAAGDPAGGGDPAPLMRNIHDPWKRRRPMC